MFTTQLFSAAQYQQDRSKVQLNTSELNHCMSGDRSDLCGQFQLAAGEDVTVRRSRLCCGLCCGCNL